jgi:carbon-monoxide dehydrogenase large subunit
MKAELPLHAPGTQLDKGYIGQSVPRPNTQRLLQGRGTFIDDMRFPRLAHVAFFRSPHAHARIRKLDFTKAIKSPGVLAVFDGPKVAEYCTPWVAVLAHLKGIKSPPQHAIAIGRACWQGEAVAAVVAESRSQAEDGVGLIEAEWEELPVVVDMEEALAGKTVIHPDFQDNVCFKREHDTGGVDEIFKEADVVVEDTFHFGRHTGVCLEGRAILADYNAAEHSLTVYHATQAPHMMQDVFSRHLGIPEANVRVICKDVGGSFGIKVHVYADEMATAAISVIMRRPVKFVTVVNTG